MDWLEITVAIMGVFALLIVVYDIIRNNVTDEDMEGY